jgi:sugar lactone lactonase YvrE
MCGTSRLLDIRYLSGDANFFQTAMRLHPPHRAFVGLLLCFVVSCTGAMAQPSGETPVTALERALAAQPEDAVLAYFLAVFRARAGDHDGAFDALEQALKHGDGLLPTAALFPTLGEDPRYAVMRARFDRRLPRKVDGKVKFELRDRTLIPEGIAYDAKTRRFYVGSIARRAIYRVNPTGDLTRISRPEDDVDAVLGIAIDARRRILYAVSTGALTAGEGVPVRNAVKAYDLESGTLVRSVAVSDARQLNDVAVAPDGTLLVTDSAAGAVYAIDPSAGHVRTVIPPDGARGANGIAIAPQGGVAYVAASRRPLRIDLASGEVTPLTLPPRENAAAIDGLYWHDGALIGIQNVTTSARIVRLALAADGRSITAVQTLQSHHQRAFDEPTTAAIAPDGLYVLARTYVSRFNAKGTIDHPETIGPPLILRVPLPDH